MRSECSRTSPCGSCRRRAATVHFARSPLTSPAIISYSSVPTDHQSTARLYGCPSSTSGATYSGVPARYHTPLHAPQMVCAVASMLSVSLESPKSVMTTCPSLSSRMFSGFMSLFYNAPNSSGHLYRMLCLCRYPMPSTTSAQ